MVEETPRENKHPCNEGPTIDATGANKELQQEPTTRANKSQQQGPTRAPTRNSIRNQQGNAIRTLVEKQEKEKMKKCLRCGGGVIPRKKRVGLEKIFCSRRCGTQYCDAKRYHRLKNSPKYKKQKREEHKKWRKKNRDHFNDLCREPNRLLAEKRRKERREKGLCTECGGQLDDKYYARCKNCRFNQRKWYCLRMGRREKC